MNPRYQRGEDSENGNDLWQVVFSERLIWNKHILWYLLINNILQIPTGQILIEHSPPPHPQLTYVERASLKLRSF